MGFDVVYDPNQNIQIAKCIKKYPVLYDTNKYPPFKYRGVIDNTWEIVAAELGISEANIKNRWGNLKGCFKRYLRNKARNPNTKSYYLASYMDFVLPFMHIRSLGTKRHHKSTHQPSKILMKKSKWDIVSTKNRAPCSTSIGPESSSDEEEPALTIDESVTDKTSKEIKSEEVVFDSEEQDFIVYSPHTKKDRDTNENMLDLENNPSWNFLLSLLPDIKKMNPSQKTKFRNFVLSTIDTVLYGEETM